jgi:hypothetical protein
MLPNATACKPRSCIHRTHHVSHAASLVWCMSPVAALKLPPSRTSDETSWKHTCNTDPLPDIHPCWDSLDIVAGMFIPNLLICDKCHMKWTVRNVFRVAQIVGLRHKTYLQKVNKKSFPMLVLLNRSKQYIGVLWLKCSYLDGVSSEHQKMRSAGQECHILKNVG